MLNNIELDSLYNGLPTLTENMGRMLTESALYCLTVHKHLSGVELSIYESLNQKVIISWGIDLDNRAYHTYKDHEEVTEWGATCIGILLSLRFTKYNTVQRSAKGGGFDYWVGDNQSDDSLPFQKMAKLEISGVFSGSKSKLSYRTTQKKKQISKSESPSFTSIVSVIEFSAPMATFIHE